MLAMDLSTAPHLGSSRHSEHRTRGANGRRANRIIAAAEDAADMRRRIGGDNNMMDGRPRLAAEGDGNA